MVKRGVCLDPAAVGHLLDVLRYPTSFAFQPATLMLAFLAYPVVRSGSERTCSEKNRESCSGDGSRFRTLRCIETYRSWHCFWPRSSGSVPLFLRLLKRFALQNGLPAC